MAAALPCNRSFRRCLTAQRAAPCPRPAYNTRQARGASVCASVAAADVADDTLVDTLTRAAKKPGSVPVSELLDAVVNIEKKKMPLPDNWFQMLSGEKRWNLVYTAASKDVQAHLKGQRAGSGQYFPLTACQKFTADDMFENGVFLGPLAHLTFKGPCATKGKQLSFDVHTMYVGIGPWRAGLPIKKDAKPIAQMDPSDAKKLPFFIYAYIDDNIIVARGRSGGLALWVAADVKWQANAGVLQVYK